MMMMNNMMNNINPMGMNNIGMNQIINSIPMDQTALNIKSIVEPYENKIRQLEEIIKQKDFEITVLKQKLNNNNMNMNNFPINSFNQMNPMINNNMNNNQINMAIPNTKDKGKEIPILIILYIINIMLKCKKMKKYLI